MRPSTFGMARATLLPYWCLVKGRRYRIGGGEHGQSAAWVQLPQFWIARLPITIAQYAQFIAAGGYDEPRWWTPHGWDWRQKRERKHPWWWSDDGFRGDYQPVMGGDVV